MPQRSLRSADGAALQLLVSELARHYGRPLGATASTRSIDRVTLERRGSLVRAPSAPIGATLPAKAALGFELDTAAVACTRESFADLEPHASLALRSWGAARRVSPFLVGLTGWASWLASQTQQADLLVPTITLASRAEQADARINTCLNVLLLRARAHRDRTFEALVEEMQDVVLEAIDGERPCYELVRESVELRRLLCDQNGLLLPFQSLGDDAVADPVVFGECLATPLERAVTQNAGYSLPFDALMTMRWEAGRYRFTLEYQTVKLGQHTASRLLASFREWMGGIARDPSASLAKLSERHGSLF